MPPYLKGMGVTLVDDLPELDDIFDKQQSMNGYPPRLNPNFSKQMTDEISERDRTMRPMQGKIRQSNDFRAAIAGGMHGMTTTGMHDMGMHASLHGHGSHGHGSHGPRMSVSNRHENDYLLIEPSDEEYQMGPRIQNIQNAPREREREISCIEIAKHIKNCPICSKFYDTDKSLYIIVIIILLIFCILLLKKILIKD